MRFAKFVFIGAGVWGLVVTAFSLFELSMPFHAA